MCRNCGPFYFWLGKFLIESHKVQGLKNILSVEPKSPQQILMKHTNFEYNLQFCHFSEANILKGNNLVINMSRTSSEIFVCDLAIVQTSHIFRLHKVKFLLTKKDNWKWAWKLGPSLWNFNCIRYLTKDMKPLIW